MWQSVSPIFLTLLLSAQVPFPIKSLALSVCVSHQIIHLEVLSKSLVSGLGRGLPLSVTIPVWCLFEHKG